MASNTQVLTARTTPVQARPTSRLVFAASGLVLASYVVIHMSGNLLTLAGSAAFDGYARWLREVGSPIVGPGVLLMAARGVLAAALFAHLGAHAWMLGHPAPAGAGACARATAPRYVRSSFPIPQLTGALLLLFVVMHLAQLTFGATVPGFGPSTPYRNLVTTLRAWPVALVYIAAAAAVGGHVLPGVWSGLKSLGLVAKRTSTLAGVLSPAVAIGTTIGLASVPAAVVLGLVN